MQLDLFTHSRDIMLQNDGIAALRKRDALAARQALAAFAAEYPRHEMLPPLTTLLHTLTTPVAPAERFADQPCAAAAVQTMAAVVAPAAHRVFGDKAAAAWLAPLWLSLVDAAAALPWNAASPETHTGYLRLQGGDWAGAEAAVTGIASWRRMAAPLGWMAEARFCQGGLEAAWRLLAELAWLDAGAFDALARRLDAPSLQRLLHQFDTRFDDDTTAGRAWFPAWLLIAQPAMAAILRETQPGRRQPPEQTARLIMEILTLEKQGRHAELVAHRKRLRDAHAGLYAFYLSSR